MQEPCPLSEDKRGDDHVHDECFTTMLEKEAQRKNQSRTHTDERYQQMNLRVKRRATVHMIVE